MCVCVCVCVCVCARVCVRARVRVKDGVRVEVWATFLSHVVADLVSFFSAASRMVFDTLGSRLGVCVCVCVC